MKIQYIRIVLLAIVSIIIGTGFTSCTVVEEDEEPPHRGHAVHRSGPPPQGGYHDQRQVIGQRRQMQHPHQEEAAPPPPPRFEGVIRHRVNKRTGERERVGFIPAGNPSLNDPKARRRPNNQAAFINRESGEVSLPEHLTHADMEEILRARQGGNPAPRQGSGRQSAPLPTREGFGSGDESEMVPFEDDIEPPTAEEEGQLLPPLNGGRISV